MTKPDERVLVIDLGDVYAHAALYQRNLDRIELVEYQRSLRALPPDQLIEALQLNFKDRTDRVEIIGNRADWFGNALRHYSNDGLSLGILVDGAHSYVGYSSLGRLQRMKEFELGWGAGVENAMSAGGMDFLKAWFEVTGRTDDAPRLLNYLGNRVFYPAVSGDLENAFVAIVGLLRYLFTQIDLESMIHGGSSSVFSAEGRRRLILVGELFADMVNYTEVVLALIDSFHLEGVWEIVIDPQGVIPSTAFTRDEQQASFDGLDLIEIGTLVVLSHHFEWGTTLGEMRVDIGLDDDQRVKLKSGEIVRLPLDSAEQGALEMTVKPNVEIAGLEGLNHLQGGVLGLIIDSRGRPLPKVDEVDRYKELYQHWKHALS